MTTRFLRGDSLAVTRTLPDNSIDLILSSPPYLALRSYLPADDPDKALEMGSEATPAEFIDRLLELTAEWRRVLTPTGSICIELGDTYSGSGGAGGDYNADGLRAGQAKFAQAKDGNKYDRSSGRKAPGGQPYADYFKKGGSPGGPGWPLAKSRTMVPEMYRIALAYGLNPLTGQQSPAGRWRVRQVHYHCRPNPSPGALGDKFRPSVSEWVIACTSPKRWFDLDAVRTPVTDAEWLKAGQRSGESFQGGNGGYAHVRTRVPDPAGAPPLDHSWLDWDDFFPAAQRTPTTPYPGAHYATFGPKVIEPFILAMCPREVCRVCGEPRRRIVDTSYVDAKGNPAPGGTWASGAANGMGAHSLKTEVRTTTTTTTLGWTDCGHNDFRPGHILDPFGGSGTTGDVAQGHGYDCTLIDLDKRNLDLARQRIGMFMEEGIA